LSLFQTIFNLATTVVKDLGYPGIFALMILQGMTLPIVPSEVMMPIAGYLSYQGTFYFWTAVSVGVLGSLVGNMIDFAIGYYLGRPFVLRYGRYIRLNEKHLATTERWFARYGLVTVFLARFVPLISTLVAFPAGIAKMNVPKFIAFSIVGIFIWDASLAALGFEFHANYEAIARDLNSAFLPIGVAAIIIAAIAIYFWTRRRSTKTTEPNSGGKT
jgi:membrane protein DedA with SNARE-associated domain